VLLSPEEVFGVNQPSIRRVFFGSIFPSFCLKILEYGHLSGLICDKNGQKSRILIITMDNNQGIIKIIWLKVSVVTGVWSLESGVRGVGSAHRLHLSAFCIVVKSLPTIRLSVCGGTSQKVIATNGYTLSPQNSAYAKASADRQLPPIKYFLCESKEFV
jgi:hypothetical protein